MIRQSIFNTVCGIAILSGVAAGQVISTPANSIPANEVKTAHPQADAQYDSQMLVNVGFISRALFNYSLENERGPFPEHLGRIASEVPSIEAFAKPGMRVPPEVMRGTFQQKSIWVQQNSAFAFPGAGKNPHALSSDRIILHERLDLEPHRARFVVLFADGTIKMLDRATLEEMLLRA